MSMRNRLILITFITGLSVTGCTITGAPQSLLALDKTVTDAVYLSGNRLPATIQEPPIILAAECFSLKSHGRDARATSGGSRRGMGVPPMTGKSQKPHSRWYKGPL
jgi:hypothetical protein